MATPCFAAVHHVVFMLVQRSGTRYLMSSNYIRDLSFLFNLHDWHIIVF